MGELTETTLLQHPGSARVAAKKPGPAPPANEWSKVRKLALRHLNRFVSQGAKVLKGDDPDAIHHMRVASRRLQQVLDLIFSKPMPREARRLRRKIRRCRRALGNLRNCDALFQQVEGRLARKRCSDREAWKAVKEYLQERRAESFSKATRKLSTVNMAVFYVRAKGILDRLKAAPNQDPASHSLAQPDRLVLEPFAASLTQALADSWEEFEKQVAASHQEMTAPSIHAARISAKRLRYLLEVVNQVGVPGSSNALAWLRKIQQHLGDWHDMEILEETVIKMIARSEFWRDQLPLAMATGKLILRNRAVKRGFTEKYFQMTQDSPNYQAIKKWAESVKLGIASSAAGA